MAERVSRSRSAMASMRWTSSGGRSMVIVRVRRRWVGCRVAMRCGEVCCTLPLALTLASDYSGGAQRADGARAAIHAMNIQTLAQWAIDASNQGELEKARHFLKEIHRLASENAPEKIIDVSPRLSQLEIAAANYSKQSTLREIKLAIAPYLRDHSHVSFSAIAVWLEHDSGYQFKEKDFVLVSTGGRNNAMGPYWRTVLSSAIASYKLKGVIKNERKGSSNYIVIKQP